MESIIDSDSRHVRQWAIFSEERRRSSALLELAGAAAPVVSLFVKAAAAAAGLPLLASDFHAVRPGLANGNDLHWLLTDHENVVCTIDQTVSYQYLDPLLCASEAEEIANTYTHTWLVTHIANPELAASRLEPLQDLSVPVLLAFASRSSVVVIRAETPRRAVRILGRWHWKPPPGGESPEMACTCAGLIVNELLLGIPSPAPIPDVTWVGYYSRNRAYRIDIGSDHFARALSDLVREGSCAEESQEDDALVGARFKLVGAGALGTWTALCLAFHQPDLLEIFDDDRVELHNLNRQVLYARRLHELKATALASELTRLVPAGRFLAKPQRVQCAGDLGPLGEFDALMVAPDNDSTRLICCDAAWRSGITCVQGGTSATGGQVSVHGRHQACFRCTTGIVEGDATAAQARSCADQNSSVVASNMVVAGLMVSELREALAGRPARNLRFVGDARATNRLARMATFSDCIHRDSFGKLDR